MWKSVDPWWRVVGGHQGTGGEQLVRLKSQLRCHVPFTIVSVPPNFYWRHSLFLSFLFSKHFCPVNVETAKYIWCKVIFLLVLFRIEQEISITYVYCATKYCCNTTWHRFVIYSHFHIYFPSMRETNNKNLRGQLELLTSHSNVSHAK